MACFSRPIRWLAAGLCLTLLKACQSEGPEGSEEGAGGSSPATGGAPPASGGVPGTGGIDDPATGGADGELPPTGGSGGEPVASDEPPRWLSETGLYAEGETLAEGVEPFEPRFPLWTDTAAKRRWISLPQGTQIDTSDPDRWVFPVGTRLWKEFTRDGVRVETRLIERRPGGLWWMVAYQWNADQSDAEARPEGVTNASGTEHDIPSSEDCRSCHEQSTARVLGFSTVQLAHASGELDLAALIERELLTDGPSTVPDVPGNPEEQELLGYLHANCGHCHQPESIVSLRTDLKLWLDVEALAGEVEDTPFVQSTLDVAVNHLDLSPGGKPTRIVPGEPEESSLFLRFAQHSSERMPPLGTKLIDEPAADALREWIEGLSP